MRHISETLLAWSGAPAVMRARRRDDVLVLAYHNVVPDNKEPAGDRSLHLPRARFLRQLDLLQRWVQVVPLSDLRHPSPSGDRPRVAITFDDAYRGAVTIALPELRSRGLPTTLFVAPGRLGGEAFWWDLMGGGDSIPPQVRSFALSTLRGDEESVRTWARDAGLPMREVPDLWRSASVGDLQAAVYPGLTLGSHSWSHPNLAALTGPEVERELVDSQAWLNARFPETLASWLAFPYGLFTESTCEAARVLGFAGALRIDGGWIRLPLQEPFAAARLNIPAGLSCDGFLLRISGLLPR